MKEVPESPGTEPTPQSSQFGSLLPISTAAHESGYKHGQKSSKGVYRDLTGRLMVVMSSPDMQ